jgi:threonine/homoserine/homoserine lactone efflux protein
MLEGITAGFILSLALFPGTVWLVKVGVVGTAKQVFVVALGFAMSQLLWLLVSIPGLLMMTKHLTSLRAGMHLFATFVLFYMAFKTMRSRRVETLDNAGELPALKTLFRNTFNRALAIPMRLPTAMAILLATGVFINNPPTWEVVPSVILGGLIGVSWWWGQFFLLTVFFVRRVPEHMTMKSLNKICPFCACLFCLLGIISLLLAG